MYCIYSNTLKKYYNFNTNTWVSFTPTCIISDKNEINKVSAKFKPEIHIITTKPISDEIAISTY